MVPVTIKGWGLLEQTSSEGGGIQMNSTVSPTRSEYLTDVADLGVRDMTRSSFDPLRPSLGRRALRSLVMFCIGVGATLAWQSYGDAARAMIANLSPQLGWLAPQTAPIAQTAPEEPAPKTASSNLQQFALDFASVRQSVDQLASQLAASQRQMGSDIAKLQAAGFFFD